MAMSNLGVFFGKLVYKGFNHFTEEAIETQEQVLKKIIKKNMNTEIGKKYHFADVHSIKDFQEKVPLTTFEDYDEYIDRMINNKEDRLMMASKNIRYCSSSGSVGKPKILPKSAKDLLNMQMMGLCAPEALVAQYCKEKGKKLPAMKGPLVMVLSGHPLADGKACNGAGQIPLTYIKPLTRFISTSPLEILYPEHEELLDSSYLQLRFALEERNCNFLGSMVVTLLTMMLEYLEANWEMLCDDIEKGIINPDAKCPDDLRAKFNKRLKPNPERAAELRREFQKGFDDPIVPRIWPNMIWAYGMVGSNLAFYIQKLRKYIGPDIPIHNMGYAAAEGFFAMPVELDCMDYVLLPRSIFFEFIPLDAEEGARPLLMQEIEVGKDYEMVVTNFSGLYRYRIEDVVRVTGMYKNAPKIEFLYRNNLAMNIANEKTTTQMVDWAAQRVSKEADIPFKGFSFYGDYDTTPPHYTMLVETETPVDYSRQAELEALLDDQLRESNEKYFKYRRWGMIGDPEVLFLEKGAYRGYSELLRSRGVVLNQIKPVTIINTDDRKEYFFSKVIKK